MFNHRTHQRSHSSAAALVTARWQCESPHFAANYVSLEHLKKRRTFISSPGSVAYCDDGLIAKPPQSLIEPGLNWIIVARPPKKLINP